MKQCSCIVSFCKAIKKTLFKIKKNALSYPEIEIKMLKVGQSCKQSVWPD